MGETVETMKSGVSIERGAGLASGLVYQELDGSEQAGRCFYTERIDTGFGAGAFRLSYCVVDDDGYDQGFLTVGRLLFGDPDVFAQSSYVPGVPKVRIGAYADPIDGTFRLGVMLKERAVRCRLTIRWWAEKVLIEAPKEPAETKKEDTPASDTPEEAEEADFYINNAPKSLKVGQKYQLSCLLPSKDSRVKWEVLSEGGGEITSYGMYTAPKKPGIYQIQATLEGTTRTAAMYLMVR
jgi:hypothetical protein